MEDKSHIKIKNYELSFGDLGIQFKFKKELSKSDIKTIMYYLEQHIQGLDLDYKLSSIFFNKDEGNLKTINDIHN